MIFFTVDTPLTVLVPIGSPPLVVGVVGSSGLLLVGLIVGEGVGVEVAEGVGETEGEGLNLVKKSVVALKVK